MTPRDGWAPTGGRAAAAGQAQAAGHAEAGGSAQTAAAGQAHVRGHTDTGGCAQFAAAAGAAAEGGAAAPADCRCVIAARAAQELEDGQVTNLGAGIPMLVANYIPEHIDVVIQAENGILGVGPVSRPGTEDPDRRNAGNLFVTLLPGGCYFDSATSFAMIRGGRVAATMLGTLQVDSAGDIANYEMPGRKIGMGGAMDLVAGARTVYVLTEHCTKDGSPKLIARCTLPLTGAGECDVIITERALFRRYPGRGFVLEEVACDHTLEEIAACTELAYTVADDVRLDAYGAP